jgi:hypothetical protein
VSAPSNKPAAMSFTDDSKPERPSRQALLHHPTQTVEFAETAVEPFIEQLKSEGCAGWPAYTIDGEPGVWVTPLGGISASLFATILLSLGDDWILRADPRVINV